HACRERLPQAGLRGAHRRWAARHSLSGRTQGATARHATAPTPALLLHQAAGAPLEQIHSGSDYRSRVTPQYLPIRASTPGKSATRKVAHLGLPFETVSAHKTQRVRDFLGEHPNVHIHYTSTYSSWLNQVEIWCRECPT